jgi:hypothetical protein
MKPISETGSIMPAPEPFSSSQDNVAEAVYWREQASAAAHEAALASRLLGRLLISQPGKIEWQPPQPVPPVLPFAQVGVSYNIESIDRTSDHVTVRGWAFLDDSPDCGNTLLSLLLEAEGAWFSVGAKLYGRPDVAAAFPVETGPPGHRSNSGFVSHFATGTLSSLQLRAYLVLQKGREAARCTPPFAIALCT